MPCGRGRDRQDLTPPPPKGGLAPRAGFMGRLAEPPGRAAVQRPRQNWQERDWVPRISMRRCCIFCDSRNCPIANTTFP